MDDKVLNPKTGRYVKKTSKLGKELLKKKSPPKKDLTKILIATLSKIRDFERYNKQLYKAQAYSKILAQLYNCKEPIYNYQDFERNIQVGEGIGKKVKEFIETGKISYIEEKINQDNELDIKNELRKIYGIGDVKIESLIKAGIKTIDDLKRNTHLLNEKQILGLKYYEDLDLRIPLDEYKQHIALVDKELKRYGDLTYNFVGSYRRGNSSMGDIDILIMKNDKFNLKELIDKLKTIGYVKETLALGVVKFAGIVKLGESGKYRRLDILIAPEEEYYYSLLYFTGSGDFNVGLRNYIKTKYNVSLSEHGIKEGVIRIPKMNSEKDIFSFFNIKYVEPSKRKIFIMP
jgi:DNA polymerase/3'-5' exonuclease PolX